MLTELVIYERGSFMYGNLMFPYFQLDRFPKLCSMKNKYIILL